MPRLPPLVAFLVQLSSAILTASADHHVCTWTGWGNDPADQTFINFCVAEKKNEAPDHSTADYICIYDYGFETKVADYGRFAAGVLEFSTPCADDGYATKRECRDSEWWALCVNNRNATTNMYSACRYMWATDDCAWTDPFVPMPERVTIWRSPPALGSPKRKEERAAALRGQAVKRSRDD